MSSKYYLPSKIGNYFQRLELEYKRSNNSALHEIITNANVSVIEGTFYDNWNGGQYGHDVRLFLPHEIIGKISLSEQDEISSQLCQDLNRSTASVENENFRAVILELVDEDDPEFQKAVNLARQPHTNPDGLSIWQPGNLRLFISHRDTHKAAAKALATALLKYGISAFVAHDTIEPMRSWQREIEKGLETMEIMLAFITDDFHESSWTNQEIGYALGKGIPIVSLKVQHKSPFGFIGAKQALKGQIDQPESSALAICKLLVEEFGQPGRLRETLISAFCTSADFNETRGRFDRLNQVIATLSKDEAQKIQRAYSLNDKLNGAYYLRNHNRLINFMQRSTGREYAIGGKNLSCLEQLIETINSVNEEMAPLLSALGQHTFE